MTPNEADKRSDFGVGELFLADSRLAFMVLNEARHRTLHRIFGVSREQANLLTFAVAFTGFHGAANVAGRVVHAPFQISGADLAIGGFLGREGAIGVAGPNAAAVSPFATLLTIGIFGGLAYPALRRTARRMRAAERRLRSLRESQYATARRAMGIRTAAQAGK